MAKLTKRIVDASRPTAKDYIVFDERLPGFGLRVMPSGKKSYLIQYRRNRRTRRLTFGRHGTMTPDQARRRAMELLGAVSAGRDPAEEYRQRERTPTVAEVTDRFLNEYVPSHCKPSTAREYRRSVELFIDPTLGRTPLRDVTRIDVAKLHHDLRTRPYQANRTLGVLSKVFNLAEVWGFRPDGTNPCRHVKKYYEQKRERFLSDEEFERLGKALRDVQSHGLETQSVITALRLLILTGCRLSEILMLEWDHVDLDTCEIRLPDSKSGAKIVHLGKAAVDILRGTSRIGGNPYVVVGKKPNTHLTDLQHPWQRIRKRAGLDDVRIHDLRHSYASSALRDGESLTMIGKLLGHTQIQTTARYAHLAADPVKQAAETISSKIAMALDHESEFAEFGKRQPETGS